jgi:hypothetical protein
MILDDTASCPTKNTHSNVQSSGGESTSLPYNYKRSGGFALLSKIRRVYFCKLFWIVAPDAAAFEKPAALFDLIK